MTCYIYNLDKVSLEGVFKLFYFSVVLTIEARDSAASPLRAECEVTVRITDENDHAPQIEVTPVQETSCQNGN